MDLFTEKFGFESDNIDAVTEELARALYMKPERRFYEGYGGDYTLFRDQDKPNGDLVLYLNNHLDVDGPITHEESYPELGLILLIEQEGEYVDYEVKLNKMRQFRPILLYRTKYPEGADNFEVLFDLAEERFKTKG